MGLAGSIDAQMDALQEYGTEPFDGDDDYSAGNALEDSGHPADPTTESGAPSQYNGHPRSAYTYTGDDRAAFNMWQEGMYSTREFQNKTAQGQGTAALTLSDGAGPTGDGNQTLLLVGAAAAVALAVGVSN